MEHFATTIANMLRMQAAIELHPRVKADYERRAAFYDRLAVETLEEYYDRTERESGAYQRVSAPPVPAEPSKVEIFLTECFGGNQPGYLIASDVTTLLHDAFDRAIWPREYGPIMRRLGFNNPQEWLDGKNVRVWRRGSRAHGILFPRRAAPPVPPPLPY